MRRLILKYRGTLRLSSTRSPSAMRPRKLMRRQVVDFYVRGGDFPVTNSTHRDFNILNLNAELQSDLDENDKVALVDYMLEFTDDRVALEQAPFDHPQLILPLDGTAPESDGVIN